MEHTAEQATVVSRRGSVARSEPDAQKRKANVYDAVQGNVTQAGLIGRVKGLKAPKKRLRPDEVLFKRKNAPIRYQEEDYYPAHAQLPADQQLPSGDLAAAIHAYISNLYAQVDADDPDVLWGCMDETALLAISILLEETARSVLGETGDLAFTEADQEGDEEMQARKSQWVLSAENEREKMKQSTTETRDPMHDSWVSEEDDSKYISDEMD